MTISKIYHGGSALKGGFSTSPIIPPSLDELVKVSAADTTADYLNNKLAVSGMPVKSILNPAGNEVLQLQNIWGTYYQDAASGGDSTTTSSTYVNKLTMTTPVIPAGEYLILWYYENRNDTLFFSSHVRVRVDAVSTLAETADAPQILNDFCNCCGGQSRQTLTNAAHTFTIDHRITNAAEGTSRIRRAAFKFWQVRVGVTY